MLSPSAVTYRAGRPHGAAPTGSGGKPPRLPVWKGESPIPNTDWRSTLDAILFSVAKPQRYVGNELNAIRKDPAGVSTRVALAFPEIYELGMSTLGMKILDRKSTRLNSSHSRASRMPSSA